MFRGAFGLEAVAGEPSSHDDGYAKGRCPGNILHEAGLGSAPIVAAAAQTKEPVRQGLVSMTGTFIDTVIICAMTGTTIMVTGSYDIAVENGLMASTLLPLHLPTVSRGLRE